tara:strand:+ start:738 stop:986 length:249 start_codon:yes stop_codon:yes gene_type:complete
MEYTDITTTDEKSYKMLPLDAKVWFKEVNLNKTIKNINEIKGPGRIINQFVKWNEIEYHIEYPVNSNKIMLSRASLIYLSEP